MRKPAKFDIGASNEELAEIKLLESLEELLCTSDGLIFNVGSKLESCIETFACNCEKQVNKICSKLKRICDKLATEAGNVLDYELTKIKVFIDGLLENNEFLLMQIAIKCGAIKIGQTLCDATKESVKEAVDPKYCGCLVLSIKEAVPYIEKLLEILMEIRDRLPPISVELPQETDDAEPDSAGSDPNYKIPVWDDAIPNGLIT